MHGPPLAPDEVAQALQRAIAHLEELGLDRDTATRAIATQYGVDARQITFLVGDGASAERPSDESRALREENEQLWQANVALCAERDATDELLARAIDLLREHCLGL